MIPHLTLYRQGLRIRRTLWLGLITIGIVAVTSVKSVQGQSLPVLTPTTPEAVTYLNQGLQQVRMGNLNRAIASFEQAVALDKNLAPAHYNLYSCQSRQRAPR